MFAGHVGAALAIGSAERRVNVGVLVTAALLLDLMLWPLVILGWEQAVIPADFAGTHQPEFVFPYSHGLVSSLAWSILAGVCAYGGHARLGAARWHAAVLVAVAVFSHWLIDALVHHPGLPLAGASSLRVGLGLWRNLPAALVIEAALVVAGLGLFMRAGGLARGRALGLAALTLLILAFTVVGMTIAPPPPSALAMAVSSLATLIVVCALMCWLDSARRAPQA